MVQLEMEVLAELEEVLLVLLEVQVELEEQVVQAVLLLVVELWD